jgi:hypothetical protein
MVQDEEEGLKGKVCSHQEIIFLILGLSILDINA